MSSSKTSQNLKQLSVYLKQGFEEEPCYKLEYMA